MSFLVVLSKINKIIIYDDEDKKKLIFKFSNEYPGKWNNVDMI